MGIGSPEPYLHLASLLYLCAWTPLEWDIVHCSQNNCLLPSPMASPYEYLSAALQAVVQSCSSPQVVVFVLHTCSSHHHIVQAAAAALSHPLHLVLHFFYFRPDPNWPQVPPDFPIADRCQASWQDLQAPASGLAGPGHICLSVEVGPVLI